MANPVGPIANHQSVNKIPTLQNTAVNATLFQNANVTTTGVTTPLGVQLPIQATVKERSVQNMPVFETTEHKVGNDENNGCCAALCLFALCAAAAKK